MECPLPSRGIYPDSWLKEILLCAKRIAIIGLSPDKDKDSHKVARYLLEQGYEVIPIYPKEETILGQKVYRNLGEVHGFVDIVDVFRKSQALTPIAIEARERGGIDVLWGQLGVQNQEAEQILEHSGVRVVQNLCIKLEHQRLFSK